MSSKRRVKVESVNGRLRLRWTHQNRRYVLSLGWGDSPRYRIVAEAKASEIELDLMSGGFDATLAKYRVGKSDSPAQCGLTAIALFEQFTEQRGIDSRTVEKYRAIAAKLRTYFEDKPADLDLAAANSFREWLGGSLKPVSQKEYVRTIKTCWDWAVKRGLLPCHPWGDVLKRVKVPPRQRPKPFTKTEIAAILEAFRTSRYYARYADFAMFQLSTGCRPGEAIGLRWSHLSEDCSDIWIGESVTRGVRKSTKTNRSREFRLTPQLQAMLINRRPDDYQPDDLVFPAARGGTLHDKTFRKAWIKVLAAAGVAYRKPYTTRSTLVSHVLEMGNVKPTTVAELVGHDPEVMFKHYAGNINGGLQLPDIGIL